MILTRRGSDNEWTTLDMDTYASEKENIFIRREKLFNEMAVQLQIYDSEFWANHTISIVPINPPSVFKRIRSMFYRIFSVYFRFRARLVDYLLRIFCY